MKPISTTQFDLSRNEHGQAGIRTLAIAAACLGLGMGVGALWYSRVAYRGELKANGEILRQNAGVLSSGTMSVLQSLTTPVEIRFYALLDTATVSPEVIRLTERTDELLSAYQRESGGKVQIKRFRSRSDLSAAAADAMKSFNLDKGDVCYLGLTVVQGGRRELIPRLVPEWEQALESDISRAISRVSVPAAPMPVVAANLPADPTIVAEVKRQIPNFASVSLEEGAQTLRQAALKEFQAALSQMESKVKEAEQRVAQMDEAKSEAGRQAALKELQALQAEQVVKLREYTSRSSEQVEALRQMKESAR